MFAHRRPLALLLSLSVSALTGCRLQGGVVSLIEVLDADGNLLQARDAKAQAQTEAARAAIASFPALGRMGCPGCSSNRLYSDLSTTDRR